MTPRSITKKQYIGWFIVFSIGMALWAWPGDLWWGTGLGFVTFGNLILMAPRERSRPLATREISWIFFAVAVFAALMFASKRWLPDDFGTPVARVVRHPALVAILWGLAIWFTYRRYSVTKSDAQTAA